MFSRVRILDPGDTNFLAGQIVDYLSLQEEIEKLGSGKKPRYEQILLGITRVALNTNSFLSAASFQETTGVLIEAATAGKIDPLRGIKENVIIGRPIPAGTGFSARVQKMEKTRVI
jgi:DNA-directed RNA polymerase subunit beta'